MRRSFLFVNILVLISVQAALAAPVIEKLLPPHGKAGSVIFVRGTGFGDDPKALQVLFGTARGRVLTSRPESIAVTVPLEAARQCSISVEVGGERSNAIDFSCDPSVHLTVGKNPVRVGEKTTGVFRVYHSEQPTAITFRNKSTDVVTFVGGDEQTVTTSGGANNHYQFGILGKSGPRTYEVDYSFHTQDGDATAKWTLPWSSLHWTEKAR